MKIYVELLVPLILIFVFVMWWIINRLITRFAYKKYNPDNDLAKKGEESRKASGGGTGFPTPTEFGSITEASGDFGKTELSIPRPPKPDQRECVQTTSTSNVGKNRLGFRNPFKRRRKSKE